jgi:hypothetical protein
MLSHMRLGGLSYACHSDSSAEGTFSGMPGLLALPVAAVLLRCCTPFAVGSPMMEDFVM